MNIEKLVKATQEIERRYNLLQARTKAMQILAADARRTGKNQSHRMSELPPVVNFEDPIKALISALNEGKKKASKLFCENQMMVKNEKLPSCLAHLAEGRVLHCPYTEYVIRHLKSCSDFEKRKSKKDKT
jgi:hypothetical protein